MAATLPHLPLDKIADAWALSGVYNLWQNGRYFADDIFRCIFEIEKFCILIKISPKFVLRGPVDNNTALV